MTVKTEEQSATVSAADIAKEFGVSQNAARTWIYAQMPYYKTETGIVRVDRTDYEAWKESRKVDPRKDKGEVDAA